MKNLGLKIIGVIIAVIILLQTNMNIVVATDKITQSDIDKQKKEKEQTLAEKGEKEKELENVQGEKKEVQKQVQDLSSQILNYEKQIATLDSQISELNTKIKDSEEKLKQAQEDYTQKEDLLEKRLVATYESGETSYLDFLLSSESITDFISNYYLVTEVATYDTELLEKIQKQKEEIEEAKKDLEENKKELDTSKASKQSITTQLQAARKEKNEQVTQLSKNEQELQKEIDELNQHESKVSNRIKELTDQYNDQNPPKPPANNNNNTGNSGSSSGGNGNSNNNATSSYGFGWPVSNNRIGTPYGVKGSMWSLGYHTGVDFPVSSGTPVFSVGNGQVVDTGYNSAYGNFVEVYHGNSVYSFYAHATRVQVSIGQKVSKGQQIMISGATGNVSGAHLHFEIRSPGSGFYSCVNPMNYLP
ncbi:MAG: peptidoglycan DD-metalloendopeptidase family protein [Clostridia bacterium]|nr:peptidoglycan DD-metalloendopeptidase family protein [Clostridia bacterium]